MRLGTFSVATSTDAPRQLEFGHLDASTKQLPATRTLPDTVDARGLKRKSLVAKDEASPYDDRHAGEPLAGRLDVAVAIAGGEAKSTTARKSALRLTKGGS